MVEDRLLIWRFKLGNQDALRRIYEKYKNDLLKLSIALANDVNTAEDIVEEVSVARIQDSGLRPANELVGRTLGIGGFQIGFDWVCFDGV